MPARSASPSTLKEGGRTFIAVVDDGGGMTADGARARGRAPLHLEAARTTICSDIRTLGLPRRGAAVDRLGQPLHASPRGRRGADSAWALAIDGGAQGRARAGRASAGHAGRGARSVLRHAGAAEVPQGAAHRIEPRRRRDAAPRHGASRRSPSGCESEERTLFDLPAAAPSLLDEPMRARLERLARDHGPRLRRQRAGRSTPTREGLRLTGYAGLPTLNRADGAAPVSLRQRPAGARPAAGRRGARRLPGFPGARPPSAGGAVPRRAARAWSTSTSIRPRPRCASATPASCAA